MAQRRAPEGAGEHPRGRDVDQADVPERSASRSGPGRWRRCSNRRPLHHRRADRVRAHVLLCMLAYCVKWHMLRVLAPVLFDDHHPAAADRQRASAVAPAQRSPAARAKACRQRTDDALPLHSSRTLLADLGTLTANTDAGRRGDSTFTLRRPNHPTHAGAAPRTSAAGGRRRAAVTVRRPARGGHVVGERRATGAERQAVRDGRSPRAPWVSVD